MEIQVILHNIRSAYNVGAIFRTADGMGASCIYLTGYTPTPIDRFGRIQKMIEKTSLGASQTVPYEYVEDVHQVLERLKSEGKTLIAVEQHARSVPYTRITIPESAVYIFGNETGGLPESVCAYAHHVVHIPMRGKKESLNVSVCAGIMLYHARGNL